LEELFGDTIRITEELTKLGAALAATLPRQEQPKKKGPQAARNL
jgi:hypothetical protein